MNEEKQNLQQRYLQALIERYVKRTKKIKTIHASVSSGSG